MLLAGNQQNFCRDQADPASWARHGPGSSSEPKFGGDSEPQSGGSSAGTEQGTSQVQALNPNFGGFSWDSPQMSSTPVGGEQRLSPTGSPGIPNIPNLPLSWNTRSCPSRSSWKLGGCRISHPQTPNHPQLSSNILLCFQDLCDQLGSSKGRPGFHGKGIFFFLSPELLAPSARRWVPALHPSGF